MLIVLGHRGLGEGFDHRVGRRAADIREGQRGLVGADGQVLDGCGSLQHLDVGGGVRERGRGGEAEQGGPERGGGEGPASDETLADPVLVGDGALAGLFGVDRSSGPALVAGLDQLVQGVLRRSHGVGVKVLGLLDEFVEGPVVYGHGVSSLSSGCWGWVGSGYRTTRVPCMNWWIMQT